MNPTVTQYLLKEMNLTTIDLWALGYFIVGCLIYTQFAAWYGKKVPSLHNCMDAFRREWMVQMLGRDNRMIDVNVIRNISRSSQFFASTTLLILGALVASMSYEQKAQSLVSGLPFTVMASSRVLELKTLLLVIIFVYAFFKFSWAIRQLNFCAILVAAAAKPVQENAEQFADQINRIARITSYAGLNFNLGLRSYYFALAALTWFLHPWLLVITTTWILYVLYHREFKSFTLLALIEEDRSPVLKIDRH